MQHLMTGADLDEYAAVSRTKHAIKVNQLMGFGSHATGHGSL